MNNLDIKRYVASLTDEELVGEILSWEFSPSITEDELLEAVKKKKISSFYANNLSIKQREFLKKAIGENIKSPCLVVTDVERGPAFYPETKPYTISMMNLAAADDESLAFEVGKYTARIASSQGIHLPLSPVVDINFNPNNPVTNTRAASDDPDTVLKSAGAYGRGMQSEGNMLMVLKHFPGDGVDDRNQHFCTTVNSLSKEAWMASYGKVYKTMIKEGADAIMVAHIALPWYDPTVDDCGHMPATLSKPIMTGLIREELGFEGCIISDAMSMIGTAARVPVDRLSVEFLRAGGDFVLFPEKDDHERILDALHSGYLERSRLLDAAEGVVKMKAKLGLFEGKEYTLLDNDIEKTKETLEKVAKKSITLVRNTDNILPLKLKEGAKVLVVTLSPKEKDYEGDDFPDFADCLESYGYNVTRLTNPNHYKINEIIEKVDAVFVISILDTTCGSGNSLRLGWNNMMTFWRGYIFKNKNLIFVSFGDPYKLSELPFIKTYVNSYVKSGIVAKSTVDACLGISSFEGKSPVKL